MLSEIFIRPFAESDFQVAMKIYAEGIATGIATFETEIPDWKTWDDKYIDTCRIVATIDDLVVGFAVLSQVSKRKVYNGVAEVSVYVDSKHQEQDVGKRLLKELIKQSEIHDFWTLQAGIFSENTASINLHKKCSFRVVGIRERIGKLKGKWHDNHLLERRSKKLI